MATIEDTFGRVRHVLEAEVQRPGMMMVSSWHISKPVMILRTYMSNSLLINNSLNNLSRTFEKHMVYGDIEVLIEAAAFSSGDLFYIRMIVEPQLKHTRIEHMEVTVTESRKYCVPEMRAWRTDETTFPMPFAGSVRLAEFGEVDVTTDQLAPIFDKNQNGIELVHDFAHRLAFFTPTCQQNIRHTTYLKEIQFRHYIEINLTLSYMDVEGNRQHLSRRNSLESITTVPEPSAPSSARSTTPPLLGTVTPPPAAYFNNYSNSTISRVGNPTIHRISRPSTPSPSNSSNSVINSASYGAVPSSPTTTTSNSTATAANAIANPNNISWQNVLLRLHKSTKSENSDGRSRETITLGSPITVFDCRLKEDYGRLPSYFELGVKPTKIAAKDGASKKNEKIKVTKLARPTNQPEPYLCACYHAFCREMELASQAIYNATTNASPVMPLLDRIPSNPPPDYAA